MTDYTPKLAKGEKLAGLILVDGAWQFLILLPGEVDNVSWKKAIDWAAKQGGGSLPTRNEQALLYANLKTELQPRWYWSCEQYAPDLYYAWAQNFDNCYQNGYRKNDFFRALAVRRLEIL